MKKLKIYKTSLKKLSLTDINKNEVIIIKNFINAKILNKSKKEFQKKIKRFKIYRKTPVKFKQNKKGFFRLDIGDYNQNESRVCSIFFQNDFTHKKFFHKEFKKIVQLKDKIYKLKRENNYSYIINNKIIYNLYKVIHYPSGGGFMNCHSDLGYKKDNLIMNFILSCGHKNNNFYYEKNKKKYYPNLNYGDLVFHKLNIKHGVSPFLPKKKFEIENYNSGRLSLVLSMSLN